MRTIISYFKYYIKEIIISDMNHINSSVVYIIHVADY